jgi:tetratricopeptide (TPR) repeat protein
MNPDPQRNIPQNGVPRLFSDAIECRLHGDYAQAIQLLNRAHGIDSANEKVLLELALAYAMSYDLVTAERWMETAIRIAPSKTDALIMAGHHWSSVKQFEAAKHCFERTLQQSPLPIMTIFRLTELYLRLGKVDEAIQLADRGLQLYGEHEAALMTRAKIHRALRQWEEAEKLLSIIVAKSTYSADARAAAGYELGTVLDAQGRYDEAMTALLAAKALLQPGAKNALPTLQAKLAAMKQVQATLSEGLIQRWRACGETQLQPARKLALLCGYPRSGTTLLEYVLDSHPQIISADETAVFQSKAYQSLSRSVSQKNSLLTALDALTARNMRQIRTDYFLGMENYLRQPIGDRWLLDKNPALTFDIPAISRIFPETKFLVALRDPRDVCLSCFMRPEPILPDTVPWLSLGGAASNYAAMMGFWLTLKPYLGQAALEVRYEDMVEKMEPTARRALEFLGLNYDERVLRFDENARSKVVRSPTYAEVTKPLYKTAIGRWRNYQKYFEPHMETLAPVLRAFGYQ